MLEVIWSAREIKIDWLGARASGAPPIFELKLPGCCGSHRGVTTTTTDIWWTLTVHCPLSTVHYPLSTFLETEILFLPELTANHTVYNHWKIILAFLSSPEQIPENFA